MLSNWPWISRCGDYWQQVELRTDGACRIMMMMWRQEGKRNYIIPWSKNLIPKHIVFFSAQYDIGIILLCFTRMCLCVSNWTQSLVQNVHSMHCNVLLDENASVWHQYGRIRSFLSLSFIHILLWVLHQIMSGQFGSEWCQSNYATTWKNSDNNLQIFM